MCRWKSAMVVVAVLLVQSVEHLTSPGCLQPLMSTFMEVKECLLCWQPLQGDWQRLLM